MKKTPKLLISLLSLAFLLAGCNTQGGAVNPPSGGDDSGQGGGGDQGGGDQGGGGQGGDTSGYYADVDNLTGDALKNGLKTLLAKNRNVSYAWSRFTSADEDPNNKNNVMLIYSRISMDKNQQDHGTDGYFWNREHTFPNSKISGDADNDNHIIFASEKKVNGTRGSKKMGYVDGGSVVKDYNGVATTCRVTSNLFDPHNVSRGIVARSTMYAAVAYGLDPLSNFESYDTLFEWATEYPVDADAIRRNEVVYSNQKNRNPFVDHPEYACKIWGSKTAKTRQICGM